MILGFSGKMGVGKSTAVEVLRNSTQRPVILVKFAQPLYDIQDFIYQRVSSVHTPPSDFIKDRKLLQWIGTEWGRDSISRTLWVDLWKARASEWLNNTPNAIIVCDDVRFDNEAETINSAGGKVILLTGKRSADQADGGAGIQGHASEDGIGPRLYSERVDNDSTLDRFKAKLCVLYKDILTERNK